MCMVGVWCMHGACMVEVQLEVRLRRRGEPACLHATHALHAHMHRGRPSLPSARSPQPRPALSRSASPGSACACRATCSARHGQCTGPRWWPVRGSEVCARLLGVPRQVLQRIGQHLLARHRVGRGRSEHRSGEASEAAEHGAARGQGRDRQLQRAGASAEGPEHRGEREAHHITRRAFAKLARRTREVWVEGEMQRTQPDFSKRLKASCSLNDAKTVRICGFELFACRAACRRIAALRAASKRGQWSMRADSWCG